MNEETVLTEDDARTLKLISTLPGNEAFTLWRDKMCYPVLDQLKAKLRHPAELSDIELRASVMHLNSMEMLFNEIFVQAMELTKEE